VKNAGVIERKAPSGRHRQGTNYRNDLLISFDVGVGSTLVRLLASGNGGGRSGMDGGSRYSMKNLQK